MCNLPRVHSRGFLERREERLNKGDMGEFVPRVGKSEGAKPRLKHFYGWTKYEIYGFTLGNRINILGFVIAKPCMRRGFAPSRIPTAGTTFPLDTLLFNASLFPFPRGVILFTPSVTLRVQSQHATGMLTPSWREAILHVSPRIHCRGRAN